MGSGPEVLYGLTSFDTEVLLKIEWNSTKNYKPDVAEYENQRLRWMDLIYFLGLNTFYLHVKQVL